MSRRWIYACGAALALEFVLCVGVSIDELARLVRGEPAVADVLGVLSPVGLVLVACLMTYLGRSALAARREVHHVQFRARRVSRAASGDAWLRLGWWRQ